MFASNSEIIITGDSKIEEQITSALSLIINGFNFQPVGFQMLPDGRAVLYERMPNTLSQSGIMEITKEDCKVSYLVALLQLHFSSSNYKRAMLSIPQCEGDGSSYMGWRISLDNYNIDDKIIIEPWWAFYHK